MTAMKFVIQQLSVAQVIGMKDPIAGLNAIKNFLKIAWVKLSTECAHHIFFMLALVIARRIEKAALVTSKETQNDIFSCMALFLPIYDCAITSLEVIHSQKSKKNYDVYITGLITMTVMQRTILSMIDENSTATDIINQICEDEDIKMVVITLSNYAFVLNIKLGNEKGNITALLDYQACFVFFAFSLIVGTLPIESKDDAIMCPLYLIFEVLQPAKVMMAERTFEYVAQIGKKYIDSGRTSITSYNSSISTTKLKNSQSQNSEAGESEFEAKLITQMEQSLEALVQSIVMEMHMVRSVTLGKQDTIWVKFALESLNSIDFYYAIKSLNSVTAQTSTDNLDRRKVELIVQILQRQSSFIQFF